MAANKRIDLNAVNARIVQKGPNAQLTRGEAAALIAARVIDRHDSVRTARNRIAMQMDRSRALGDDYMAGGLARLPNGKFTADEIARWAMRRHADVFKDLPTKPRTVSAKASEELNFGARSSSESMPGGIEASHALIMHLRADMQRLKAEAERTAEEPKRERVARFKKK